jgi:hypothetical protein
MTSWATLTHVEIHFDGPRQSDAKAMGFRVF